MKSRLPVCVCNILYVIGVVSVVDEVHTCLCVYMYVLHVCIYFISVYNIYIISVCVCACACVCVCVDVCTYVYIHYMSSERNR